MVHRIFSYSVHKKSIATLSFGLPQELRIFSIMSTAAEIQPDPTKEQITTSKEPETAAQPTESETSIGNKDQSTYTGIASSAASNAATTASSTAAGVKDSVFSMFGGGAKKDKKEDDDAGNQDRSGSSKAKKEAEAEDDEVYTLAYLSKFPSSPKSRINLQNLKMFISSLSFA